MAKKKKGVFVENIDEFLDVLASENHVSKQEVMLEMFDAWRTLHDILDQCEFVLKDDYLKDNIDMLCSRKIKDYFM